MVQAKTILQDYQQQKANLDAQAEYNRFQWEELEAASFRAHEVEELEAEYEEDEIIEVNTPPMSFDNFWVYFLFTYCLLYVFW
mgnify:CR=1 FL=1